MNDGGKGDGHSSKSVIWRRTNFHPLLALNECDLASGIVALGKCDVLHVEHRTLAKRTTKIGIPFLFSFFGLAQVLGWEPMYITNLMGHDLTIIVVQNLLFIGSYGINMDVIQLFVLFEH
jgi:hypothetical protein